jgi:hypothetical protein
VHIDPRVREQEFGNLQEAERMRKQGKMASKVGRFYFRSSNPYVPPTDTSYVRSVAPCCSCSTNLRLTRF